MGRVFYVENNDTVKAVKALNFTQVQALATTQKEIDYAFYAGCYYNTSWDFLKQIIELGVKDFTTGCVAAMQREHYGLLYSILSQYGHDKQIEILGDGRLHCGTVMVNLAKEKDWLQLYALLIEFLPNHTQAICKRDKYYAPFDFEHYDFVYNMILGQLLVSSNLVLPQAVEVLARRKFPVYHEYVDRIINLGWQDYFPNRLNGTGIGNQYQARGIAHRKDLVQNDKKLHFSWIRRKELFQDLAYSLNIPERIKEKMENFQNFRGHLILPDYEDYLFLQSFESKPHILDYFRGYFYYDKMKIHEKLSEALLNQVGQEDKDREQEEPCHKI
jgi:hypothetical protein